MSKGNLFTVNNGKTTFNGGQPSSNQNRKVNLFSFENGKTSFNNNISMDDYNYIQSKYKINPTQNTKKKKKNGWFDTSLFDDGYQVEDLPKTIVGTAVDTIDNLIKGASGIGEGFADLGLRGASGIASKLGNKKLAKDLKKIANINLVRDYNLHRNTLNNISPISVINSLKMGIDAIEDLSDGKTLYDTTIKQLDKISKSKLNKSINKIEKKSISGDKLDNVVEGVGQYAGMVGLQMIGIPWQVTSGVTSFNAGLQEADENGAKTGDAIKSALISAGGEIASEYLTGGLGKLTGTGAFDKTIKKQLTKNMKSLVAKNLASFGYDMAGEGIEEVISGYVDAFGKKITYMKDKDIKEIYSNKEALNDFVAGALVSGIAGVGGAVKTTKAGRDLSTGNTANEQKIIDSETQKRLDKELAKDSNKNISERQKNVLKEKIENQVTKDVMNGKTSIDTIYDVLGKEQTDDIINNYRNKDTYLKNSVYNEIQKGKQFQYEKTGNLKKDTMLESLSKVGNNSIQSQEIASLGSKLIDDLNVDVEFINNNSLEDLKKKGLNIDTLEDKNGFQVGNKIYLNVDSSEYCSFVMGHEMTHILENNKEDYQVLQDTLFEYAKAKGVYEEDLNNLKETYSNIENADVLKELSANYVGNFFTDEDFVNNLTTKNPNLVVRIYNSLKTLYYKATGQKEKLTYQQALNTIQKVYRNYSQSIQGQYGNDVLPIKQENQELEPIDESNGNDINYMITGKKGMKNAIKQDNNNQFLEKLYNKSREYQNNNVDNEEIRRKTGWFKDKEGNEKFEISDDEAILNKNLSKNKKYKLKDVLFHEDLFTMYPSLKKVTVKTMDISTEKNTGKEVYAQYFPLLNRIELNNKFIGDSSKLETVKKNILHEIQHKIQKIEGFNGGSTGQKGLFEYLTNLGEIEASDTEQRMNMTEEERLESAPESSKENPIYPIAKKNKKVADFINKEYNKLKTKDDSNVKTNKEDLSLDKRELSDKGETSQNRRRRIKELDNSSFSNDKIQYSISNKEKQLDIINKSNPADDEIHTWIRSTDDIKTFEEAFFEDGEYSGMDPDYTEEMANDSLKSKEITIYSSYPIENGVFVSPSQMEASQYAGGDSSKLYSKTVNINDVAWIDGAEGQYAPIKENDDIRYSKGNLENNDTLLPIYNQNRLSDSKVKKVDSRINKEFGNDILPFKQNVVRGDPTRAETYEDDMLSTNMKDKTVNEAIQNALKNKSYSAINIATREGHNYLNFSGQERQKFREELSKYLGKTKEELTNPETQQEIRDIVNNYATREMNYVDEEVKDIKKQIRNTKINVPKEIQKQITDYSFFRKSNFGNLKLGNKGMSIDVLWQELSDAYPYYFNKETTGESDMLYELSDFMQKDVVTKEKYKLSDGELDVATTKIFNKLIQNTLSENDLIDLKTTLDEKLDQKITRHEAIQKFRNLAKDKIGNILAIKDKKRGISYQINTMKRNLRDIMSPEQAQSLYETYFQPISENNAKIEKEITKYNERIAKYDLNEQESVYTQMLGELKYNPETSLSANLVEKYLNENKRKINQSKVNNAIQELRSIYDETRERFNEVLIANGYLPVEYRKGYFPHFTEDKATSIVGKMAEKMGWKIQSGTLPTTIAGITDTFRPGRVWTSFSQQRTGDATDYNALKGFDNYIRGAMELMYHTEDIQKLRALENEIRYQYSDKGIKEKIDDIYNDANLDAEEQYEQASKLNSNMRENPLGNFATELKNYTDNLANKKAFSDRDMEQSWSRRTYSIMTNVSNRVSANMVGMNISSAITNFIPITQAWSQTSTKNLMRGMLESIRNTVSDDGFVDGSVYLTNRTKTADRLYKTKLEKINDKLGLLFEGIDSFSSNTIVRAKYYDNLEKGMSEVDAMRNADEFAKDVIGGRSKGDNPTIFNKKNPLAKLFTAFQLEVNNQYGYMLKDIPFDLKDEAKSKLIMAFAKLIFGAWLYNQLSEKITGRKSAFSPIDIAMEGYDTFTDDNIDLATKITNTAENVAQELPFIGGLLGGGRLPIQSALPYSSTYNKNIVSGTITDFQNLFDDEKRESAINELLKEWAKPVYFVGLPFAGGQIKKTIEGASMYKDLNPFSDNFLQDRELAGSYTNKGDLRFEADTSPLGVAQSLIFGQYSGKNAVDYFSGNNTATSKDDLKKAKEMGMSTKDYQDYKTGMKEATKTKDDNGYFKYKDDNGNIYWYDKKTGNVYNSNYKKTNKSIYDLEKVSSTELLYDYVDSLNISNKKKNELLNDKLGSTNTDKYGNIKYKSTGEYVYDSNGLLKVQSDKGTTYWYDTDTGRVYNSSGKVAKVNKNRLTPVTEDRNYFYDKKHDILYDSDYNVVDSSKLDELTKFENKRDISKYKEYGDYEEFYYATSNPDKYNLITSITDFDSYQQIEEDIKGITGSNRKNNIQKYINSLNLSRIQKIMLFKKYYNGYDKYNKQIIDYVRNLDKTQEEKENILKQYGFVISGGKVRW